MSLKELRRLHVIRLALAKKLRQRAAATALGLTVRQVRRLIHRVRVEGDTGWVHRAHRRPSNRRWPAALKARVLQLYAQYY